MASIDAKSSTCASAAPHANGSTATTRVARVRMMAWPSAPARRAGQAAFQQTRAITALGQQERRCRTAGPGLGINDILLAGIKQAKGIANLGERDVDRSVKLIVLILGGVTHVEPGCAG